MHFVHLLLYISLYTHLSHRLFKAKLLHWAYHILILCKINCLFVNCIELFFFFFSLPENFECTHALLFLKNARQNRKIEKNAGQLLLTRHGILKMWWWESSETKATVHWKTITKQCSGMQKHINQHLKCCLTRELTAFGTELAVEVWKRAVQCVWHRWTDSWEVSSTHTLEGTLESEHTQVTSPIKLQ